MFGRLILFGVICLLALLALPTNLSATQGFTENPGSSWLSLNSTNGSQFLVHNSGDGNNLELASNANGTFTWQILSISKNGNVGIGTNNAQSKLHVAGDVKIQRPSGSELLIQTPASDVRMFGSGGKPFLIPEGNVCIGCYSPTHKLSVNGTIKAREILVSTQNWADYVFDKDFKLMSLSEVERYIEDNNHLPNIPSARDIESQGISVGEMQRLQMGKIEELTLHAIQQEKENNILKSQNEELANRLKKIEKVLNLKY